MADVEVWERAGLYDPDAPGAAERRALLEYLTDRGATIDQMVEAHKRQALPGVAGDLVTQGRTPAVTVGTIAERSQLPVTLVMRVLVAAGIPAEPTTEVPADLVRLLEAFKVAASIMGEEGVLAFTRVLGAAAANVAESAVALFFAELGPGTIREGPDELSRARLAESATAAFTEVPEVLAHMVMEAFERAQRRSEEARGWEAPGLVDGRPKVAATEVVALGFVDLVGSTVWAQQQNLRDLNLALTRFESAAWSSAVLNGGRVVKMIGDGVFFAATTAEAACRIATEVLGMAATDELLPPARGVVGVGPVVPREGDYFGPLVNLLARLVKAGAPGELVATEQAVQDLPPDEWHAVPLEPAELRGIGEPIRAFHVEHRGRSAS